MGTGGAIVLASDPQAEYDEMILKALVPLRALLIPARDPATQGLVVAGETSLDGRDLP